MFVGKHEVSIVGIVHLSIMLGHVVYNAICFVSISSMLLIQLIVEGRICKILTHSLV